MHFRRSGVRARTRRGTYLSEPLEPRTLLNSYLVNTVADTGPNSLRQAITDANNHPGADTITFQISGAGVHAITPLSPLPFVTDPLTIDGTTQTGYTTTPLIQLNGASAGNTDGLAISAGNSSIKALAIGNFAWSGISIFTNGNNTVQNCFIGTDPTGATSAGNGDYGIAISNASASNQILNNLISGNGAVNNFQGIQIDGVGTNSNVISGNKIGTNLAGTASIQNCGGIIIADGASANQVVNNLISGNGTTAFFAGIQIYGVGTTSNIIAGNKIGTDTTGTQPLGNGGTGIYINGGAQFNRVGTNGDGSNDSAERNIISANGANVNDSGVVISDSGTNNNVVAGNYIGTDITGALPLGNGGEGVGIWSGAQSNRVGVNASDPDAAAERNIISANGFPNFWPGVELFGSGTNLNVLAGNYIGVDVTGLVAMGNAGVGLMIHSGPQNNRIGTNGDGIGDLLERNIISNSGYQGIYIGDVGTTGNTISGNYIGASANASPMGNLNNGIWIDNGAAGNRIGTNGTDVNAPGESNLIIANAYSGIAVTDPVSGTDHTNQNSIRGNSIHNNGPDTLGLNVGGTFYLNHGSATELGPNNRQNYPVLLSGTPGASTNITGNFTAVPNTAFAIDFYTNSAADQPFAGAGDRWLGFITVTTNGTGTATFSASVATASSGEWITATATDPAGNTSEFSSPLLLPTAPIQLSAGNWTPIGPAPVNETKGNGPVIAGRVDYAVPDPTNSNVVYIASDSGGIWKTTDWLDPIPQWTPLTDSQPSPLFGNVSYEALAIAPSNSQILYAGVSWPGGGILRTTNGGATWTELANSTFDFAQFGSIVIDPTNANIVYASVWYGPANGGGVYKSIDGGATWTNTTASIHTTGGAADLIIDPSNPQTLYAGLVGDTTNGSAANGIFKTIDGGAHWNLQSNGVLSGPAVGVSVRLAIAPSSPQTLYATVFDPALGNAPDGMPHRYKTVNGGSSWTALGGSTDITVDEPRYWHALLSVDPHNPSIVYTNGDHVLYISSDGGATFDDIYDEDPVNVSFDDTGAVIMTGDRGIYRWTGGAADFQNKHGNLQNIQFYSITLDPTNPSTVYGIGQDHLAGMKTTGSAIWNYMGGGDEVGRVVVDPTNPNILYEYDPNNGGTASNEETGPEVSQAQAPPTLYFVWRSTDGGSTWTAAGTGIPTNNVGFNLAYTSQRAFVMDPSNHSRLLVGVDSVYETTNQAGSWHAISPVLSPGQFVSAIGIAASAPNTVYAATGDGKLFVTTNNSTWTERDAGLPQVYYSHVMDIQVDPANPQRAFVVLGYFLGGVSDSNHVFMTNNGGISWTNITGNLPNDDVAQAIAVDWRFATPRLYIGTLRGAFLSTDTGAHWTTFGSALPNTIVTDLELSTAFNVLAAGTNGRGAFEIRIPASVNANVITGTSASDSLSLVLDSDHAHIDWTLGPTATGQMSVNDAAGLTINGIGGADLVTLDYTNGSPLPNILHFNGNFTINGLSGATPFANTRIEIAQSTLYFTYSPGQSPATAIQQALRTGYNSGAWNGSSSGPTGAITSNIAAAAPPNTFTIGYADSIDGIVTGQPANTVEVRYTVVADANLDRTVNVTDALLMARHYLLPITNPAWDIGNFNYDSAVNYSDALLLQKNWNTAATGSAVPAIAPTTISDFVPLPTKPSSNPPAAISNTYTPPPSSNHHQRPAPRKQNRSHPR